MAEVKDYFTDAGTLDRQEFGNLFASSIHLHDDTACGRATLLQCLDTRYWPSPMGQCPSKVKVVGYQGWVGLRDHEKTWPVIVEEHSGALLDQAPGQLAVGGMGVAGS